LGARFHEPSFLSLLRRSAVLFPVLGRSSQQVARMPAAPFRTQRDKMGMDQKQGNWNFQIKKKMFSV